MLKSLFIRNFVLIDSLDIKFDKGFSVITGETGAGKSIILGALSLVLGQRADGKSIKNGSEKCVIEAVFDVSRYKLEEFFLTNDLEYDAEICILRRELFASGKSRAFVNDSPVPLSVVKELGSRLIDIHSQHQNLLLGDNRFQLKVIDVMAENDILLILYRKEYSRYLSLKKELKELTEKALQTKQEEDYVRFQLEQLADAGLVAGEQEELEQELETLSHAEEIKGSLYKITRLLDGSNEVHLMTASNVETFTGKKASDFWNMYIGMENVSDLTSLDITYNGETKTYVRHVEEKKDDDSDSTTQEISYTCGDETIDKATFTTFYSSLIGLKAQTKDESLVQAKDAEFTAVFHMTDGDLTFAYSPYDSSFYYTVDEDGVPSLVNKNNVKTMVENYGKLLAAKTEDDSSSDSAE